MTHMTHGKFGIGTVLSIGIAIAGTLAMAPTAVAVTPGTATISLDCGSYGAGAATLTATRDGTDANINVSTSATTSPIHISENSVTSKLTLTKNGSGTTEFSGNSNPAIPAGGEISTGPLSGTVAAGDRLEAKSLQIVVLGVMATCKATTAQSPGPLVF